LFLSEDGEKPCIVEVGKSARALIVQKENFMRAYALILTGLALFGPCVPASAQDGWPGMHFSDTDWELACDNTGTCRAAGYSVDGDEHPVSVLLTRKAGPAQAVTGEVMISMHDPKMTGKLGSNAKLTLLIGDQEVGSPVAAPSAALSKIQVGALLEALRGNTKIEFSSGRQRWRLSERGSSTVFLKMDYFQKRLGTRGALLQTGALGERKVMRPMPAPVINTVAWPVPVPEAQLTKEDVASLRTSLRATVREIDCPDLFEGSGPAVPIVTERLSASRLLVIQSCWSTVHNAGRGYWVIDDAAPFNPVLITTNGSQHGNGGIVAAQKAHDVGECWSNEAWTWTGAQFVHTAISSPGLCRAIANGAAWPLPRLVTQVKPTLTSAQAK
jgi:hypothetical protein